MQCETVLNTNLTLICCLSLIKHERVIRRHADLNGLKYALISRLLLKVLLGQIFGLGFVVFSVREDKAINGVSSSPLRVSVNN